MHTNQKPTIKLNQSINRLILVTLTFHNKPPHKNILLFSLRSLLLSLSFSSHSTLFMCKNLVALYIRMARNVGKFKNDITRQKNTTANYVLSAIENLQEKVCSRSALTVNTLSTFVTSEEECTIQILMQKNKKFFVKKKPRYNTKFGPETILDSQIK